MGWLKLDDQITHHDKFLQAGAAAAWLWVCCLAHCQRQLSDGFISARVLPSLGSPTWKRDIAVLVAVHLLDSAEGGYQVHDYLDHNASRAEVLSRRAQDSARKGPGIRRESSRIPSGIPLDSEASRARPIPSHPIPSHPESTERSQDSARAPTAIKDHAREEPLRRPTTGSGVMAGMLPRDHLRHKFCGERVCMVDTQFAQFCRDFGGDPDTAAERVKVFCEAVNATWLSSGAPIGDDLFEFWRARKLEHFGTTRKTAADKKREREEAIWAQS